MWLHSSVGRASHLYRGGHGFESRWSPDFFQASSFQSLKLENLLRWSFFTFIVNHVKWKSSWIIAPFKNMRTLKLSQTSTKFFFLFFFPLLSIIMTRTKRDKIKRPLNSDNGHFSVSQVTSSYTKLTAFYRHWLSEHCRFS